MFSFHRLNQEAFNLADQQCYPSKIGGALYGKGRICSLCRNLFTDRYIDHDVDIAPQLRMIISNQVALNPFSQLIVRRWDFYDEDTIMNYEIEMRDYIRNLSYDAEKVQEYRNKLLETWGI